MSYIPAHVPHKAHRTHNLNLNILNNKKFVHKSNRQRVHWTKKIQRDSCRHTQKEEQSEVQTVKIPTTCIVLKKAQAKRKKLFVRQQEANFGENGRRQKKVFVSETSSLSLLNQKQDLSRKERKKNLSMKLAEGK